MCFWLIDDVAMTLALDGQEVNPRSSHSREKVRRATALVKRLLGLLESNPGVHTPHPEEVIFLDRLAQLYVMLGDTELAQEQFREAHAKSCICAGVSADATLELKRLADHTPTSAQDLQVRQFVVWRIVVGRFCFCFLTSFFLLVTYRNIMKTENLTARLCVSCSH